MWGTIRCHKNVNFLDQLNEVSTASFHPVPKKRYNVQHNLGCYVPSKLPSVCGSSRKRVVPNSILGSEYGERDGFLAASVGSSRKIAYWKKHIYLKTYSTAIFYSLPVHSSTVMSQFTSVKPLQVRDGY